jgi:hypothetical protein
MQSAIAYRIFPNIPKTIELKRKKSVILRVPFGITANLSSDERINTIAPEAASATSLSIPGKILYLGAE